MTEESCSFVFPGAPFLTPSSSSLSLGANLLSDEICDTTSDLMLAQMLQMQFDREFDDQLRREEKKFNGDSKGRTADKRITVRAS